MKIEQASALLSSLQRLYPRQSITPETFEAYCAFLLDLDYACAVAAVDKHVSSSAWWPSVAELRIAALSNQAPPGADAAWDEVIRAIAREGRDKVPKWSHPIIERVVNGIGGWQTLCNSEDQVADRSQFMRMYPVIRQDAMASANAGRLSANSPTRVLIQRQENAYIVESNQRSGSVSAGSAIAGLLGKGKLE